MKKFEVIVYYEGSSTYVVEARNADSAAKKARRMFGDDEPSATPASDYEKVINEEVIPFD